MGSRLQNGDMYISGLSQSVLRSNTYDNRKGAGLCRGRALYQTVVTEFLAILWEALDDPSVMD